MTFFVALCCIHFLDLTRHFQPGSSSLYIVYSLLLYSPACIFPSFRPNRDTTKLSPLQRRAPRTFLSLREQELFHFCPYLPSDCVWAGRYIVLCHKGTMHVSEHGMHPSIQYIIYIHVRSILLTKNKASNICSTGNRLPACVILGTDDTLLAGYHPYDQNTFLDKLKAV